MTSELFKDTCSGYSVVQSLICFYYGSLCSVGACHEFKPGVCFWKFYLKLHCLHLLQMQNYEGNWLSPGNLMQNSSFAKNLMFYTFSSCSTAFIWNVVQLLHLMWVHCLSVLLLYRNMPNKPICSMEKEFIHLPVCIQQLINIQLGGLRVCVMDGCRWGVWQLINALIISSKDLPLPPVLTEWAVCCLTSNAVLRARPLLSALPGSHSFSSQRKISTLCAKKVYKGNEMVL